MRSRIIGYSLVFIVFLFFDAVFVPVRIFGVGPCILLSATVCLGIFEKERFGAIYGLVFGLFLDFATSAVFGVNALAFMIIGFVAGVFAQSRLSVSFFGALLLTAVSAAVYTISVSLLYSFFESQALADVLLYATLPRFALTVPAVIVTYPLTKLLSKLFARREERRNVW
ncbi:MAG: rod shape-determining protein MreD [Clostridia bacterium]|nr:rod shape-determining protein MreD [Clostridia bacterium]MBR5721240.1 rod shape-determining protein MreD [Clostridia bacterium]